MFKKRWVKALTFCCLALVLLAACLDRVFVLPVLMYHSVADSVPAGNRLIVSQPVFDRQMRLLRGLGFNILPLEEAGRAVRSGKQRFGMVSVTFDDGYEDNFTHAFPVLSKYRVPATIFLIYSKVGTPGYLNWEQIRLMRDSGLIVFGSHTVTHPALNELGPEELDHEISGSKKLLEERLDAPVTLFAYPMGLYNADVRRRVEEAGYLAAAATNPGKKAPDDDVFLIKRLRISENAANPLVFLIESSGYYNFIRENRHK